VLGEINGIGIVIRADAMKVMGLLLAGTPTDPSLAQLLPNFLMIGAQISGGIGPLGLTGYLQLLIDFKHYQIGLFYGGGLGVSIGLLAGSVAFGPEVGLGYCTSICHNISNYGGYGLSIGGSTCGLPIGDAPIGGGGFDANFSGDLHSFGGYGLVLPNGKIMYGSGTIGVGTPNAELHGLETYSIAVEINTYTTLEAFQTDLYNNTLQYTGRIDWATTIALYAGLIPHEDPRPE